MGSIMKKLQIIAILVLAVFFMFSCISDEDEEEEGEFLGNDTSDTVPDGNSDTTGDTLPDTPTEPTTEPTAEPTNPTDPTEPTNPTDPAADNDPEPVNDDTAPATDNDSETPSSDDDVQQIADEDSEPINDSDFDPETDNDLTNDDIQTDYDIETDDDDEPSGGIPECSSADITPCLDSSSGHIWSKKSSEAKSLDNADSYCSNLSEEGYPKGSWRMPEIYELRTLIKDCGSTVSSPSSSCLIGEDCLTYYSECDQNCSGCAADTSGKYSKLGDSDTLWSSSSLGGNDFYNIWILHFRNASFDSAKKATAKFKVRCIKK